MSPEARSAATSGPVVRKDATPLVVRPALLAAHMIAWWRHLPPVGASTAGEPSEQPARTERACGVIATLDPHVPCTLQP